MTRARAVGLLNVDVGYLVDGWLTVARFGTSVARGSYPTRDGGADLPVCARCEEEHPAAEAVLDLLRGR